MSFQDDVIAAAKRKTLFTRHALDQMNKPERMITEEEVKEIVMSGNIIEEYSEDPRGHSCLMNGRTAEKRPVHVVCAPKGEYLAIITAYVPNLEEWDLNFEKRKG